MWQEYRINFETEDRIRLISVRMSQSALGCSIYFESSVLLKVQSSVLLITGTWSGKLIYCLWSNIILLFWTKAIEGPLVCHCVSSIKKKKKKVRTKVTLEFQIFWSGNM